MPNGNTMLYASVGADLMHFSLNVAAATLTRHGTVSVPANVQYAWPHASREFLYAASSDSASGMGAAGTNHHVSAFRVDPSSGALSPHGTPIPLPHRPIHMSTDIPSEQMLVAFNNPPGVKVYRINPDATLGAEVAQPADIDPGIFPHQVLAIPDNRHIILVARGHDAAGGKPGGSGRAASLPQRCRRAVVKIVRRRFAPNGGCCFWSKCIWIFILSRPWIYGVSLERQNALAMFTHAWDFITAAPAFQVTALAEPDNIRGHQAVGTVHVHPNGRFVGVANFRVPSRDRGQVEGKVFAGGENSIAAFW